MKQSRFIIFSVFAIIVLIIVVAVLVVLLNPSISPITVFAATETATATNFYPTSTATLSPIPPTATAAATATATPAPTLTFSPEPPTLTPTNTFTPSLTPTITQTPTATPIERVLVQVVVQTALFRNGPGTVYSVISRLNRGNKILLSGISEDSAWYMFRYADADAWISADPKVTTVLEGNPLRLPVIPAPPTPTPGPTRNVDQLDWRYCVFNNNMSEEAQNDIVQQMYTGANNDDWKQAGHAARQVYLCAGQAAFYVLYAQVYQNKTAVGTEPMEMNAALGLFMEGWNGQ